ncbi:MAG: DUF1987 domain-containing protein [Bacteroidota bacterium]
MEALNLTATSDTPKVILDAVSGTFEISERCFPEDATGFFMPIIDWLKDYCKTPNPTTNFDFKLEYYNTASSKQVFKVLVLLEELSKKNEVVISWHYSKEDSDMVASGERYSKLLQFKFNMVEI